MEETTTKQTSPSCVPFHWIVIRKLHSSWQKKIDRKSASELIWNGDFKLCCEVATWHIFGEDYPDRLAIKITRDLCETRRAKDCDFTKEKLFTGTVHARCQSKVKKQCRREDMK